MNRASSHEEGRKINSLYHVGDGEIILVITFIGYLRLMLLWGPKWSTFNV
jgi:hypothetical protein